MTTPVLLAEQTLPDVVLDVADELGDRRALVDASNGCELSYGEVAGVVRAVGGRPKTVVLTRRNLVAKLCQMRVAHRLTATTW
jgi:hypothetical protein